MFFVVEFYRLVRKEGVREVCEIDYKKRPAGTIELQPTTVCSLNLIR